jgi:hypothetical protein
LLVVCELRIDGKRKYISASRLGIRKIVYTVAQVCKCRFEMQRARIIDLGVNPVSDKEVL